MAPRVQSCGCVAVSRRRCTLCDEDRVVFVACSRACLQAHQRARHPDVPDADSAAIAARGIAALNRRRGDAGTYASHRERLMRLVCAVQRGDGICVLGAGNCDDLDLPQLVRAFGSVHLVDVDGAALAGAVARAPEAISARLVAHGGVDLTGCLARIDDWTERLPDAAALAAAAGAASAAIAAAIGRSFDVVLSACVLSQLDDPFRYTLSLQEDESRRLAAAIARAHLATMLALARPGGTAVLATEQDPAPVVALAEGALASLVDGVRVTEPWTWQAGRAQATVTAVLCTRADGAG